MNDEQSKRLGEAADALIQAGDTLDEARETINDRRFDGDVERDRVAAAQQMSSKIDNAAKKVDEAIRKGAVAAAACGRAGAYALYREALWAAREGRGLGRSATEQDGSANKRARATEAVAKLESAIAVAARIVFVE
jgi:hypothetical protein